MAFYETLERHSSTQFRRHWFDTILPRNLEYIESLVTQELKLGIPALAASTSGFQLAYEKRDPTLIPTCFRHGSYNVVFFLKHEIGRVVLRLPFPDRMLAAEAYCKEFATLQYLKENTSIPVPNPLVMGYDEMLNSPYLILSDIGGFRLDYLATSWQGIPPDKLDFVRYQLAQILGELLQCKFDSIGTLDMLDGGQTVARPTFGEGNGLYDHLFDAEMPSHKAMTCSDELYDFLERIHTRIWVEQADFEADHVQRKGEPAIQSEYKSRQAFAKLLDAWKERMKPSEELGYRLQHPDLRAGNIIVDPRTWTITGVIDWEFARIIPLSLYCLPTFSNMGELVDAKGEWWPIYQRDSVSLLELAGIASEIKDHFKTMSEVDFLIGFHLMSFMPCKLTPCGLLEAMVEASQLKLDEQGVIEVRGKTAQVQAALRELEQHFTASELKAMWNEEVSHKYRLGPSSRHLLGMACAIPLPKSDDCT